MIRLIIFDIGGVLEDFNEDMYVDYICGKLSLDKKRFAAALKPKLMLAEEGKMGTAKMLRALSAAFSVSIKDLEWQSAIPKLAKMNRNVVSLANALAKKHDLVLLTNISRSRYISNAKNNMLKDINYKHIFASCFMGVAKPNIKAYTHVTEHMGVKPDEAIFIDDHIENVRGANAAGLHGICYTTYGRLVRDLNKLNVKA